MASNFDDFKLPFLISIIILGVLVISLIITTIILFVYVKKLQKKIKNIDYNENGNGYGKPSTDILYTNAHIPRPKYDTGPQKSHKNPSYKNDDFDKVLDEIVFAEDMHNKPQTPQNPLANARTSFTNDNFMYSGQENPRRDHFVNRPQQPWRKDQRNNYVSNDRSFY